MLLRFALFMFVCGLFCWNFGKIWSGRLELNQRPPEPHSGALPGCATSRLSASNNIKIINLSTIIICVVKKLSDFAHFYVHECNEKCAFQFGAN